MNTSTQSVWEIIGEALFDDEPLAADLEKIFAQDYRLFLSEEQRKALYSNSVKLYVLEKLKEWYDWLPNTTMNLIGGELALEAVKVVDWQLVAEMVREHFESEKSHATGQDPLRTR